MIFMGKVSTRKLGKTWQRTPITREQVKEIMERENGKPVADTEQRRRLRQPAQKLWLNIIALVLLLRSRSNL